MYNRNITLILCLVFLLGLFFQYNRTDGFVRLIRNTNAAPALGPIKEPTGPERSLPGDKYLVVYDAESVYSLLLRRNIENTFRYLKKNMQAVEAKEYVDSRDLVNCTGVILALENLDNVRSLSNFRAYVRQGGNLYFMFRPIPGPVLNGMYREMGFSSIEGLRNTTGVKMHTNLLIGGKGFTLDDDDYVTSVLMGTLDPKARLHMSSYEGLPLLWEYDCGKGKYIVYNGSGLTDKINRGILAAMLGLGRDIYVYPVAGIRLVFIDDFPAPMPPGAMDKVYQEYNLTMPQFYRQVWWPDMLKTAAKYNLRYTGMIIETYNNQVSPPFAPENDVPARTNLIVYGRELIKSGGELGVHGYNHQPLAPQGYKQQKLGYNHWNSEQDMALSLAEVKRYVEEVYPDYKLKVYVPPSNILSPEGRKVLVRSLPDLKVISSLYNAGREESGAYIQEFAKSPDGIFEIPRISSDYTRDSFSDWSILNAINLLGVFSHFIHPDEILYPENTKSWREMHKEFDSLMQEMQNKYNWLRNCTVSRGADYLEDYFNLDYRQIQTEDRLTIACWGFREDAFLILKTGKKIKEYQGCQVDRIDENVYLLRISAPEVNLRFESEAKQ